LAEVVVPEGKPVGARGLMRFAFGVAHVALIYAMGYFLIATALPSIVLIAAGLWFYGPVGGIAAAFISVPIGILSYTFGAIGMARIVGPVGAGRMSQYSLKYLRHWFEGYLLENTKAILQPVYATIYCPSLLRALGARIAAGSEISTVTHINPHLLDVGENSFLADACLVGGQRVNGGLVEIGAVRIGSRSFVGNSALVSGGHTVGDDVLIGVVSTPPSGRMDIPENTRWLGSPGFELPHTQRNCCFNETEIFAPTRKAIVARTLTDTMRILLPGFIMAADGVVLATYLVVAYRALPLWVAIAGLPLVATVLAAASVLMTALIKKLVVGTITPTVKPLWSRFIWNNELVNGVFEMNAAAAMTPLLGTPFISAALRLMGCKIGKWCYLETTLFSEFDLVEIGDRACLNIGSTVQNHLFEDRIFKADRIKIGKGCTVGNMGVVLYGTEMQDGASLGPLSVLRKGEVLPANTRWQGTPCAPLATKPSAAGGSVTRSQQYLQVVNSTVAPRKGSYLPLTPMK
jgi:non-ribosomal peptide synthetase-like protein